MTMLAALAAAALLTPAAALEEFGRQCSRLDGLDAISERASAAGWQSATLDPESVVAKNLAAQGSFRSNLPNSFESRTFAKPGDERMTLVLFRRVVGDQTTLECQLHIPAAETSPEDAELRAWSKREPSRSTNNNGMRTWWWEPGIMESHSMTGISFVATDSRVREMLPVAGLTIMGRHTLVSN